MNRSALPLLQQRTHLTVDHVLESRGCEAKLHSSETQLYHLPADLHRANYFPSLDLLPPLENMDIISTYLTDIN